MYVYSIGSKPARLFRHRQKRFLPRCLPDSLPNIRGVARHCKPPFLTPLALPTQEFSEKSSSEKGRPRPTPIPHIDASLAGLSRRLTSVQVCLRAAMPNALTDLLLSLPHDTNAGNVAAATKGI